MQAALLAHDWPGNVRELEHLVSRSALKALAGQSSRPRIVSLTARHFDLPDLQTTTAAREISAAAHGFDASDSLQNTGAATDLRSSTEAHQRQRIEAFLVRHHDNWASATRDLGLHRANLVRLAKRLGLPGKEAG